MGKKKGKKGKTPPSSPPAAKPVAPAKSESMQLEADIMTLEAE